MTQTIFCGADSCARLKEILESLATKRYLLVCDQAFPYLPVKEYFDAIAVPHVQFNGFTSNPLYEDVCRCIKLFNDAECDTIVAIGGGSSIDVAKCVRLYCRMDPDKNYLTQTYKDSGIPLIAIPTTAGTGSESTRYAVIYYQGEKQSVTHDSIIPDYAILDNKLLRTLPLYQKKCTMLDALCQGIESWWSVNSNNESKLYSKLAIEMIWANMDAYIHGNSDEAAAKIMLAANYAGRAINITQTTAAHAMSYKLTSLYQLPHGHAVSRCLPPLWKYMEYNLDKCIDSRGSIYLQDIFEAIAATLGADTITHAIHMFEDMLARFSMNSPETDKNDDLILLTKSVNPIRLKNTPVHLSEEIIYSLYCQIVKLNEKEKQ